MLILRAPRLVFLLMLAPFVAFADAPAVHVCVDARGHVAYQNAPCPDGQRTRDVRPYRLQPVDAALASRTKDIEQEMDRRNRGVSGPRAVRASSGRAAKTAPDPCKAAKAKRKSTLDRVGLKRTYDLLSRLDGEVWEHCKGL